VESQVGYLFVLIFFVVALNFYLLFFRNRKNRRRGRITKAAVDEAKQALWRDKEVARRIEREQEDAYERVKLRNETLAIYDEVRKRAADRDTEGAIFVAKKPEELDSESIERYR